MNDRMCKLEYWRKNVDEYLQKHFDKKVKKGVGK